MMLYKEKTAFEYFMVAPGKITLCSSIFYCVNNNFYSIPVIFIFYTMKKYCALFLAIYPHPTSCN